MSEDIEETAQRIAVRGRELLLARLRHAFKRAASAHADVLELDDERLEEMVQRAADNADGVQWRRALATVATEELGIGLGEALGHPAVVRAQSIAGAPAYEEGLAAVGGRRNRREPRRPPQIEPLTDLHEAALDEPEVVRLTARHLHGVPDLAEERGELALSLSAHGLDVARADESVIGRLAWEEIVEFDILGGRRMRRRTELIVRTSLGEATFEVASSSSKLRRQLEPLIERYLVRAS